jgi:three-Cys-motif partner protein
MKENKKLQNFGGPWTEEKLDMFTDYLNAYLTALQKQKFKKIYIDAFAGTGEIETRADSQILIGSAKRALMAKHKFDRYFFIEKDEKKKQELQYMVENEFHTLQSQVTIYQGDANVCLEKIISNIDWRYNRGLLFLDPYATDVNWSTLEKVSKTKAIDVWYLFPLYALNRMLPRDGRIRPSWEQNIDRILGSDEWKTEFYKKDQQISISDLLNKGESEKRIKAANPEKIKEFVIKRLQTIFPCVSKSPRIFRNSKNAPMFLYCFAISNDSIKAQKLALKIANHILKKQ